jgi:collagen type I/II/III/V/XI/XXIV/XXVII alpha
MANTVKLKRSATSGDAPSASDLDVGEVAINTADGLLYTKHTDGTINKITIADDELSALLSGYSTATDATGSDLIVFYDVDAGVWERSTIANAALQGEKGQKGQAGADGADGSDGDKGQKGEVGSKGQKGEVGATGNDGSNGSDGDKGQKGQAGNDGSTGSKGEKGQKGEVGVQGNDGGNGDKGQKGQKGEVGANGSNGSNGSKGEKGQKGQDGTAGGDGSDGDKGQKGEVGAKGQKGQEGNFGGATFDYTFSTNTADSDPTNGKLKFNNATLSSASVLYIDDVDSNGTNVESFLRTIDDSTSTIKGHFRISNRLNADDFAIFTISGTNTEATGYHKVNCSRVSGSATSFSNSEDIIITFARTGDAGDAGATGAAGNDGAKGQKGQKGQTGAAGGNGSNGSKGQKGEVGAAGSNGTDGSDGGTGQKGQKGEVGANGSNGSNGAKGQKGQKGEVGANGSNGSNGSKGQKGQKGEVGAGGSDGSNGSKGEKGQKGQAGSNGSNGTNGSKGQKGEKGQKGQTGSNGSNGSNGSKGQKGEVGLTDAPYGAVATYGTSNSAAISWSATEEAMVLQLDGDSSIGAAFPAFRVNLSSGETHKLSVKIKASATDANGLYIRVYEYNSTLPSGKVAVSHSATNALVQEDTSGKINWIENGSVSTDWQTKEYTYTPTSGAQWASIVILNWDGMPASTALYIRDPMHQLIGSSGQKGQKGEAGSNGTNGSNGTKGQKGQTGSTGGTGGAGQKGQKGEVGVTGSNGSKGQKGQTGSGGSNGDKGQKGEGGLTTTIATKLFAGGTGPSTENLNTVANSVSVGQLEYRGFNSSSTNAPPMSDNANGVITVGQHGGNYNAQLAFSSDGNMYWRDNPGTSNGSWREVWDSGNDGGGSGLDADTVDGLHGTDIVETSNGTSADLNNNLNAQMFGFSTSTANRPQNYGQGLTVVSSGKTHNNSNNWATQIAFGTDQNSMYFRGKTNAGSWNSWRTIWHTGNDGSGSGLDADTVDGVHASSFVRSDAADTKTGVLNLQDNLDMRNDSATAARFVHIPRGGGITLYGDGSTHHGIFSRNEGNSATDDILISSYNGLHIDLDSNNNNTTGSNFTIGKHNTATSQFTFNGETSDLTVSGNVTAYSDKRLKDNIETLDGSKVYDMRGVSFTKEGKAGSGVVAQELQAVAPELVNEDGEYLSVAYGNVVGYLIEAIKELKTEVDDLKTQLAEKE